MKALNEYPVVDMDVEQARLLIQLVMMEQKITCLAEGDDKLREIFENFDFQVLLRRLHAVNHTCTPPVILMAISMCDSPADCVMWAYTLYHCKISSMIDLCRAFPLGFPTKAERLKCWEDQKLGAGNRLDNLREWK